MSRRRLLAAFAVPVLAGGLAAGVAPDPAQAGPDPSGRPATSTRIEAGRPTPARDPKQVGSTADAPVGTAGSTNRGELLLTKIDDPDPVIAGRDLVYTLTVGNVGRDGVDEVQLIDTLPSGVRLLAVSRPCDEEPPGVLTCQLGRLEPNSSATVVVQVRVPANFQGRTLTNTAVAVGRNAARAGVEIPTVVRTEADLAITKVCKPDAAAPAGGEGFCDIYVDNLGPSDAAGVVLTDVLTSATPFQVARVRQSQGSCAPPVGTATVRCELGALAAGGRAIVRVVVTAADVSQINDVATVSSTTSDPDTGNNKAVGRVDFTGSADLSLDKSGPDTAVAGTRLTYTIDVANAGPSVAHDVLVRDTLPGGVSFVSVETTAGTCANGQPDGGELECGLGDLAAGASVRITVVGLVSPDVVPDTMLFNAAVVSSATADPDNGDVRDSVPTRVTGSADLSVAKLATPDPVAAGAELRYTLAVANAGPSAAQQVLLTDTLPAGTSFVSGVDGDGNPVCAVTPPDSDQVLCPLGTLGAGQSRQVFVTVLVAAATPDGTTLSNTVTASSPTPDPDPDDNSVTITTQVTTSADLWIDAVAAPTFPNQAAARSGDDDDDDRDKRKGKDKGTPVVLTLTVHNDAGCRTGGSPTPVCGDGGPSDAQNVSVVDRLPFDADEVSVESLSPECAHDPQAHTVTCTVPTLAAGATVRFTIRLKVEEEGRSVNVVTVTSATPDPNLANNTQSTPVVVWKKD